MKEIKISCGSFFTQKWGDDPFFQENISAGKEFRHDETWCFLGYINMPLNPKWDIFEPHSVSLKRSCCETLFELLDLIVYVGKYVGPLSLSEVTFFEDEKETLVIRDLYYYYSDDGSGYLRYNPNRKEETRLRGWKTALPALNAALKNGSVYLEIPPEEIAKTNFNFIYMQGQWQEFIKRVGTEGCIRIKKETPSEIILKEVEKEIKVLTAKKRVRDQEEKRELVISFKGRDDRLIGMIGAGPRRNMIAFPSKDSPLFQTTGEYWWAEFKNLTASKKAAVVKLVEKIY